MACCIFSYVAEGAGVEYDVLCFRHDPPLVEDPLQWATARQARWGTLNPKPFTPKPLGQRDRGKHRDPHACFVAVFSC